MSSKSETDKTLTVGVILPPDLYAQLKRLAKKEDRSMGAVVRRLILAAVARDQA